jgi:3-hydroxyacyl-CoA dehydrogenase/enoyl-CoA hydratase/3-hydroxybutyryl-CoA epimerase
VLNLPPVRRLVASRMRRQAEDKAPSAFYPAPYALITLWERFGNDARVLRREEVRSFARLIVSDAAQNLIRVFLLRETLKKLAGRDHHVHHVHVIGAGAMGGDIAAWCAWQGLSVTLADVSPKPLGAAVKRASALFEKIGRKRTDIRHALDRLTPDLAGSGVAHADIVIEAAPEKLELKKKIFADIEPRMKPGAILATNTSSIVLEELARDLADPGRLVGLHFFNPVAKMMLVEIIRSAGTRPEVAEDALAFTRRLDKLPLPCRSSPGFVVNRVLMPYMTEAMLAADEGVPLALIDKAAVDFGMPMGPIELADTVGLDVATHVGKILSEAFGLPVPRGTAELLAAGHVGRKSGRGYYEWRDGKPVKPPADGRAPEDLIDRLILQYLNEAVACLREGVVEDADLLDAGMIFGTGFAPFRGGPLHYARARGVPAIVARLEALASADGPRCTTDAGWSTLGASR